MIFASNFASAAASLILICAFAFSGPKFWELALDNLILNLTSVEQDLKTSICFLLSAFLMLTMHFNLMQFNANYFS